MISYQQAKSFLDNILELPSDWETTLKNEPLEFLGLYMRHHAPRVPFQNVTLAAVEKSKRARPTEQDIITQGLSRVGGCCLNLNFFTKILFQALGLDAFAIKGTHYSAPVEGTHCMVIVRLEDGNLFMVEVGGAFPILEPVPMQNLPFTMISAGGFPYEFRQISDDLIGRYHINGGLIGGEYIGKSEALRTSWDLIPREFSEFDYPMFETFVNPQNSPLLRNPMMYRYFLQEEVNQLLDGELAFTTSNGISHEIPPLTTKSKIFIFAWKKFVIIGDKHARRLVKKYASYKDMESDLAKYFPMLEPKEVHKACKTWSEHEVVFTPYDAIL